MLPVSSSIPEMTNRIKKNDFSVDNNGNGGEVSDRSRLAAACEQVESMFLAMMLKEMRRTIPDDGLIPRSNATRMYQSLFDNQLAENLASRKVTGIGALLYRQLA
jgi:flagellar protein FlgJ